MHSIQSTILAVLASAAVVNADFYIIRSAASNPPNCVGDLGCTPVPASTSTNVIGIDDFNCDALNKLQGADIDGYVDPVCPADGKQGGQPFSTDLADSNNACGLTNQKFYFRVQPQNSGQLDAATDPDFNSIVANCYKAPNCGEFDQIDCSLPASYHAVYRCGPLNGSKC